MEAARVSKKKPSSHSQSQAAGASASASLSVQASVISDPDSKKTEDNSVAQNAVPEHLQMQAVGSAMPDQMTDADADSNDASESTIQKADDEQQQKPQGEEVQLNPDSPQPTDEMADGNARDVTVQAQTETLDPSLEDQQEVVQKSEKEPEKNADDGAKQQDNTLQLEAEVAIDNESATTSDDNERIQKKAEQKEGAQTEELQRKALAPASNVAGGGLVSKGVKAAAPINTNTGNARHAKGSAHSVAKSGVRGATEPLPHFNRIQQSFGKHDISGVRTRVGGDAAIASKKLHAKAYASGEHIAFQKTPDLHLAAHEAAHIVQQQNGVELKQGIGEVGDAYEEQADAVADRVDKGQSAEALLSSTPVSQHDGSKIQKSCSCGSCAKCKENEKNDAVQLAIDASLTRTIEPPMEEGVGGSAVEEQSQTSGGEDDAGGGDADADAPNGGEDDGSALDEADDGGNGDAEGDGGEGGADGAGSEAGQQAEKSGEGQEACNAKGEASCFNEDWEKPSEDDKNKNKDPKDPEPTETLEEMLGVTETVNEVDDCPVDTAINAESTSAMAQGAAAGVGAGPAGANSSQGGAPTAANTEAGQTSTSADANTSAEGGSPATGESSGTEQGNSEGGAEGGGDDALSSVEQDVANAESLRVNSGLKYDQSVQTLKQASLSTVRITRPVSFQSGEDEMPGELAKKIQAKKSGDSFFSQAARDLQKFASEISFDTKTKLQKNADKVISTINNSIATEKRDIDKTTNAAIGAVNGATSAAINSVNDACSAAISAIDKERGSSLTRLSSANESRLSEVKPLETTALSDVNELYRKSLEAHEKKGKEAGEAVEAKGRTYREKYTKCKINKSDGFFIGHLTDRRAEAQANAATKVAEGFKKSLQDAASKQGRDRMKGRKKDRCLVISAGSNARKSLADQLVSYNGKVNDSADQSIAKAKQEKNQVVAALKNSQQQTIQALLKQAHTQRQAVNDSGYLQQLSILTALNSAGANIQDTVGKSIETLVEKLDSAHNHFAENPLPEQEELKTQLGEAEGLLKEGLARLQAKLIEGRLKAEEKAAESELSAVSLLTSIASKHEEQAKELSAKTASEMQGSAEKSVASLNKTKDNTVASIKTGSKEGIDSFKTAVKGFIDTIKTTKANIKTALDNSATSLAESLVESAKGADCEIPKAANLAASKEQPAWKSVLKWVLIIAIVIVVAVVVGPAVIGLVGAAAGALGASAAVAAGVGAVIGGAIVGAATSATIQVINNAFADEDLLKGVGEAAIAGAIGGAIGAAVGVAIGAWGGNLSILAREGVGLAADAVQDLATQYITTGTISAEAFFQGMAMSLFTAGLGHVGPVKAVQAKVQHKTASVVPGSGAKTYADSIAPAPKTDVDVEAGSPAKTAADADADGTVTAKSDSDTDGSPSKTSTDSDTDIDAPKLDSDTDLTNTAKNNADAGDGVTPPKTDSDADSPSSNKTEADDGTSGPKKPAQDDPGTSSQRTDAEPAPPRKGHSEAGEVEPGVVAKQKTGDHEVKVLKDGRVIACSTCGEMRLKYDAEMNANPALRAQLDRIEAMGNARQKAKAAANLRQQLENVKARSGDAQANSAGAQRAKNEGLPDAPPNYHWKKTAQGDLVVARNRGQGDAIVPLKYNPDKYGFEPNITPPAGYHWTSKPGTSGEFNIRKNPGNAGAQDVHYDNKQGRFVDANGLVYVPPIGPNQRPTWRDSELRVEAELTPQGYKPQQSFKGGHPAKYGESGTSRPEMFRGAPPSPPTSVEVKNYNVSTPQGRKSLVDNIAGQVKERVANLPSGTSQEIRVDVRGQNMGQSSGKATLKQLRLEIAAASGLPVGNITFIE